MDVFVYGLNEWGDHNKGRASIAVEHYGAKNRPSQGWNGAAYAIVIAKEKNKEMPIGKINMQLGRLVIVAASNQHLSFDFGEIESNGRALKKQNIEYLINWIEKYNAYNIKLNSMYYEYLKKD